MLFVRENRKSTSYTAVTQPVEKLVIDFQHQFYKKKKSKV